MARVAELEADLAAERERCAAQERQLAAARAELSASEERRIEREREWAVYSGLLAKVRPERLPGGKLFAPELPAGEMPAPAPPDANGEPKLVDPVVQVRSLEIARALRTLFTLEEIRGLALLECGTLDGATIGPVVFRMLDGQGRFAGSLFANRLRMEASRSARTLTLVLEDGYETRGGLDTPFERGASGSEASTARRIVLEHVDPRTWADDFRELFGASGPDLAGDDGLWDLAVVRQALNELLKSETAGGTYRLRALGGVQDGCLLDVHVERANEQGEVERRLFADRMRIARSGSGVELALESGVQVRGADERVPFLEGRYRILLPAADAEAWTRAGLPGLSPPLGMPAAAPHGGAPAH
ncbi:MAG TPA: hypothetical protein VM509_09455 [Planctomycetota bacterium]|nr:hypothetical protein [Planctomycetota bacterium]